MSDTQNQQADTLRQKLLEADTRCRNLLLELYLKHGGDTRPILEMLFQEARPETVNRIEAMLSEGGES